MRIDRLDHLVLTVADLAATVAFYTRVLGFQPQTFEGRQALHFGHQKINLHRQGHEFEPKVDLARPGTAGLCFVSEHPLEDVVAHFGREDVAVELGPVERTGALGPMRSVYIRDPDRNLIEICVYEMSERHDEGHHSA